MKRPCVLCLTTFAPIWFGCDKSLTPAGPSARQYSVSGVVRDSETGAVYGMNGLPPGPQQFELATSFAPD